MDRRPRRSVVSCHQQLGVLLLASLVIVFHSPPAAQAVRLRGEIQQIGFRGSGGTDISQGSFRYRIGSWIPVRVELTNEDGDLFEGRIEIVQPDRDGDEVVAVRRDDVSVRGKREFWLFVPGGLPQHGMTFGPAGSGLSARIYDPDGDRVPVYVTPEKTEPEIRPRGGYHAVDAEDLVVLDISSTPLNHLNYLVEETRLSRPVVVVRSSPSELPNLAEGLDMADIIVWDDADPGQLDLSQREALIQWTRRGGVLVMAVGRNWDLLNKSEFADLLPARLNGVASSEDAPGLSDFVEDSVNPFTDEATRAGQPMTYCPITRPDLAVDAEVVIPQNPQAGDRFLALRRPFEAGEMVLVTAELRDVMERIEDRDRFLRRVLEMPLRPSSTDQTTSYSQDLFGRLQHLFGFQVTGQLYFLFAFLFVVGYIAVATGGTWFWLRRRNRIYHAWPVFAVVTVLASFTSLFAVQLIRGIGTSVHELTFVDLNAGSDEAVAVHYLGLKTGTHTVLDACVPPDWTDPDEGVEQRASLMPLPPDPDPMFGDVMTFPTVERYEAVAGLGELRDVPLRATLKELQAVWNGQSVGQIDAQLNRIDTRSAELAPDGFIHNKLNVDLQECYLIVSSPRGVGGLIYPVGELAAGQQLTIQAIFDRNLAAEQGQRDGLLGQLRQRNRTIQEGTDEDAESATWEPYALLDFERRWLQRLGIRRIADWGGGMNQDEQREVEVDTGRVAMLMNVLTLFDQISAAPWADEHPMRRSLGRRIDRSRVLDYGRALLTGISFEPGPARLCVRSAGDSPGRWRPIQPRLSTVMYRVVIPVEDPQ